MEPADPCGRCCSASHPLHLELKLVSFPYTLLVKPSLCVSCTSDGETGALLVSVSGLHFPESAATINPANVCFSAGAPGFGTLANPELHNDLKYTKPKHPQQV